jgi:hypothetical protein
MAIARHPARVGGPDPGARAARTARRTRGMGYGIGGILILILVILAIIYFARRV